MNVDATARKVAGAAGILILLKDGPANLAGKTTATAIWDGVIKTAEGAVSSTRLVSAIVPSVTVEALLLGKRAVRRLARG